MSGTAGAVLVFERDEAPDVERVFGPWGVGSRGAGGAWDPVGLADARLTLEPHDTGHDLLVLRFSSTASHEPEPLARVEQWLALGGASGARLGFLTRYDHALVDPWLRDEVLVPRLVGDWARIDAGPYARILECAAERPLSDRRRVGEGPWGAVVSTDPPR
ncbi:MAG: hypothetical protein ABMA64_01705 [Myxococcota bacterium]